MPIILDVSNVQLCSSLYEIGGLKFGEFTVGENGRKTVYYVDLRMVLSYPTLTNELSKALLDLIINKNLDFDRVCGIPYTAVPLSTLISVALNKPMVMRRKEPKSYSTKMLIEGKFEKGDRCIIIDDVIASGTNLEKAICDIESCGMTVAAIFVIIDREEEGIQKISARGYAIFSLYKISQVFDYIIKEKQIPDDIIQGLQAEINIMQLPTNSNSSDVNQSGLVVMERRLENSMSIVAKRIFTLISKKETNLCVAADISDMNKLLPLANEIGPYICILKIKVALLDNYIDDQITELKRIANHHDFLIMDDKKLADVGTTIHLQYDQSSKWATLVTAHSVPGFGLLEAVKTAPNYSQDHGIFLIAEMRNENNLLSADYIQKTIALAKKYPSLVAGIICHSKLCIDHIFVHLSTQFEHATNFSCELNGDIMVVGKYVTSALKPADTAKEVSQILWNKYLRQIQE